ncbi:sulfotransferase [Novosphingobium sp. 1949]|uniref:Sulfotransferase n=1 Tax=Novosphingobium organovorum TaxID=2930092 RepID=A0ABT0BFH2_9SPHN|nr:sulfotransferase [Novosphingobium organovorum]MCJ2183524.1 sulfotransferase [Novosphingobium organovorum]
MSGLALRESGKRGLGWLAGRAFAQCSYANCLFVLAHMRCGSTALSNVICSRPDISGYGETHVRHDGPDAPGRLAVNGLRRGGWRVSAPYQFDKILHSRLDRTAPPAFYDARAIFVVRQPEATIPSIVRLFAKLGRNEYRTQAEAADYYIERVGALAAMWHRFPAERRIGLTHGALLADPDAQLARISRALAIDPPLENTYRSHAASRRGGGGDPYVSARHSRIEPSLEPVAANAPPLDLPPATADEARRVFEQVAALFQQP